MKYDYIVWDFNGTIIDDVKLCLDILNKMLSERNIKTVSLEEYKEVFTFPVIDYYKKVGFDFSKESFSDLSIEFINLYQKASLECDFCKDVIESIKKAKSMGISQILLSASFKDNLEEQVRHFQIDDLFDHIYGISNIYAESKTHIAQRFRDRVGEDKKVLMIGDSLHDKEVADSIKADCILVSTGHQSKKRLQESKTLVVDTAIEIFKELDK